MRVTITGACLFTAGLLFTAAATAQMKCGDPADVDTCDEKTCVVLVNKDTGGSWKVTPYNLMVTKSNVRIMFLLLPADAKFFADPSKHNGMALKAHGKNQFDNGQPTDKFNSHPPSAEGRIWEVKFKNMSTTAHENQNIEYLLTFQDGSATVTCDPLINNSGPITVDGKRKSKQK